MRRVRALAAHVLTRVEGRQLSSGDTYVLQVGNLVLAIHESHGFPRGEGEIPLPAPFELANYAQWHDDLRALNRGLPLRFCYATTAYFGEGPYRERSEKVFRDRGVTVIEAVGDEYNLMQGLKEAFPADFS